MKQNTGKRAKYFLEGKSLYFNGQHEKFQGFDEHFAQGQKFWLKIANIIVTELKSRHTREIRWKKTCLNMTPWMVSKMAKDNPESETAFVLYHHYLSVLEDLGEMNIIERKSDEEGYYWELTPFGRVQKYFGNEYNPLFYSMFDEEFLPVEERCQ